MSKYDLKMFPNSATATNVYYALMYQKMAYEEAYTALRDHSGMLEAANQMERHQRFNITQMVNGVRMNIPSDIETGKFMCSSTYTGHLIMINGNSNARAFLVEIGFQIVD